MCPLKKNQSLLSGWWAFSCPPDLLWQRRFIQFCVSQCNCCIVVQLFPFFLLLISNSPPCFSITCSANTLSLSCLNRLSSALIFAVEWLCILCSSYKNSFSSCLQYFTLNLKAQQLFLNGKNIVNKVTNKTQKLTYVVFFLFFSK